MPVVSPVVPWEEVRGQELAEIITRRVEARVLTPARRVALIGLWAGQGLLPPEASPELTCRLLEQGFVAPADFAALVKDLPPPADWDPKKLAEVVEAQAAGLVGLMPDGTLDARSVTALVEQFTALGLLPPEASHLRGKADVLQQVVREKSLVLFAKLLAPVDIETEIDRLSSDQLLQLDRGWKSAGVRGAAEPPLTTYLLNRAVASLKDWLGRKNLLPRDTPVPAAAFFELAGTALQGEFADPLARALCEQRAREDLARALREGRVEAFVGFFRNLRTVDLFPTKLLQELTEHRLEAVLPVPGGASSAPVGPEGDCPDPDSDPGRFLAQSVWLKPGELADRVKSLPADQWAAFLERRKTAPPLKHSESHQALVLNALFLAALLHREVAGDLAGLALSGGGIRSASFNLGLLQALYENGMLLRADYLATVSGGGYVGSLLSSLTLRPDVHLNDRDHFPLQPGENGKQPERVVRLVRSGSYLNRPWLFTSRYLAGLVANNLVLFSAVVCACALVAWLWRALDWPLVAGYLTLRSDGWVNDGTRPFLPTFLLLAAWLCAWPLDRRRGSGPLHWFTTVAVSLGGLAAVVLLAWGLMTMAVGDPYPGPFQWLEWVRWEFLLLPLLLLTAGGLLAWVLTSIQAHARLDSGWAASWLLLAVLATAAIGVVVLLGNPRINWSTRLELKDQPLTGGVATWHQQLLLPLLLLLVAALVPVLWMRHLLDQEKMRRSRWQPWLFWIASRALMVGLPLLLIFLLARHNVSGRAGANRDYRLMYTDFRDWDAFWDKVRREPPGTPGYLIWERLDKEHKNIIKDMDRRRADGQRGPQSPDKLEAYRKLREDALSLNLPVPLPDRDRLHRAKVVRALNQRILGDAAFAATLPVFATQDFRERLIKNHPQWHLIEIALFKALQDPNPAVRGVTLVGMGAPLGQGVPAVAALLAPNYPDEGNGFFQARVWLNRSLLEVYYAHDIYERTAIHRTVRVVQGFDDRESSPETTADHPEVAIPLGKGRGVFLVEVDQEIRWWWFCGALAVFVFFGCVVNLNYTSLHGIYRRQLARVYIERRQQDASLGQPSSEIPLCDLDTCRKGAPYHLLGATLNTGAGWEEHCHPTSNFLFSRRYCGSRLTGYVPTDAYLDGQLDLATAMAISGAAVSPTRATNPFIAFLMVVLNLRLGQWLPSPRFPGRPRWLGFFRLLASLGRHRGLADRRFWFISDGGHNENLGLGMLLRRECRFILVSDAGYDPDYGFDDFVQLYRRARLQGIRFRKLDQDGFAQVDPLVPGEKGIASHRYLVAHISYPSGREGYLVYLKPSFIGDEEADLRRFRTTNPQFPHDPTTNQWFTEEQVESYRELGYWIGTRIFAELAKGSTAEPAQTAADIDSLVERWDGREKQDPGRTAPTAAPVLPSDAAATSRHPADGAPDTLGATIATGDELAAPVDGPASLKRI